MVLAEKVEVRECVFRERSSDIFETLGKEVLVLEA
jgi:hypothetical protein